MNISSITVPFIGCVGFYGEFYQGRRYRVTLTGAHD